MRAGVQGIDHPHQRLVLLIDLVDAQREITAPLDDVQFVFLPPWPDDS
jgi:hypothetical protein